MQSLVWTQQWIAPLDAKRKIKTGRFWEHKTGKLIAPNNIDFQRFLALCQSSFEPAPGFFLFPCPN